MDPFDIYRPDDKREPWENRLLHGVWGINLVKRHPLKEEVFFREDLIERLSQANRLRQQVLDASEEDTMDDATRELHEYLYGKDGDEKEDK